MKVRDLLKAEYLDSMAPHDPIGDAETGAITGGAAYLIAKRKRVNGLIAKGLALGAAATAVHLKHAAKFNSIDRTQTDWPVQKLAKRLTVHDILKAEYNG